jgi:hypothetical protein
MELADLTRDVQRLQGWRFVAAILAITLSSPLWSWPVGAFLVFVGWGVDWNTTWWKIVGSLFAIIVAPLWLPFLFLFLIFQGKEF